MSDKALFERFRRDFLGLDVEDEVIDLEGRRRKVRRVYLDSTATALMPRLAWLGLQRYLETAQANSHTHAHRAGAATTEAIEEARRAVGALFGCDPARHLVIFTGNGATGAVNFLARALFPPDLRLVLRRCPHGPPHALTGAIIDAFPEGELALRAMLERPLVVSTVMEHHSNLLPWFEAVGRHNVRLVGIHADGTLDLEHYRKILREEGARVRLVAVAGVSNVTGVINPVHEMAALAHQAGAQIAVDAAQMAPHRRIDMSGGGPGGNLDFVVVSGHKLYAPGSRGVLLGELRYMSGHRCIGDVGGGMVDYVTEADFRVKDEVTAREEAGTPNIPGTVVLGLVARILGRVGMDVVEEHERALTAYALATLGAVDGVELYGPRDPSKRAGVISFNVRGLPHALTAAFLNDMHDIAVRNECFCAHPYVKRLLGIGESAERAYVEDMLGGDRRTIPGMVRASLGIYSTRDDVDRLATALRELVRDADRVRALYTHETSGAFTLENPALRVAPPFDLARWVDDSLRLS